MGIVILLFLAIWFLLSALVILTKSNAQKRYEDACSLIIKEHNAKMNQKEVV